MGRSASARCESRVRVGVFGLARKEGSSSPSLENLISGLRQDDLLRANFRPVKWQLQVFPPIGPAPPWKFATNSQAMILELTDCSFQVKQ